MADGRCVGCTVGVSWGAAVGPQADDPPQIGPQVESQFAKVAQLPF